MTIGTVVLTGLLAMAPNWAIVDIPYPEAAGGMEAHGPGAATPEARITAVLTTYIRGKSSRPLRRDDIVVTRIDGTHASARLVHDGRNETVYLELAGADWRIVKVE